MNGHEVSASTQTTPRRFVQIDEEGYFKMDDLRVADAEAGRAWLASLRMDNRGRAVALIGEESAIVEAFDEPFIVLDLEPAGESWIATLPYGHKESFDLETLTLDEWDRFHGRTKTGVPFVLSRAAQARFFDLVDAYDDDSITVAGRTIATKPWLQENPDVNQSQFWTQIYRTEQPRWELGAPAHALPTLVPKLKLQRSRILVLGAGQGNDAAWFAEQGHIVTAVDFSEEAIARAKEKYGHLQDLTFLQSDVFALPASFTNSFDIVFEHTCYCAITPGRRNELVKVWKRVLADGGHVMGVFFAMDKPFGPPYGGSEWEIRSRLDKSFRPLYWVRMRDSLEQRLGHELFVYAQKLSSL